MIKKRIKIIYVLCGLFLILIIVAAKGYTSKKYKSTNIKVLQNEEIWKAPKSADKLKMIIKDTLIAAQKGKVIFEQQCIICHGETGKGDGIAGTGLNPRPSDLTSENVQNQSDGAIFWKITTGNPPMASYKEIFSKAQRWQLVLYIRSLNKKE